ncbi:Uncharacterised protein [Vibrio cholerae]|nr:Uncharacterised protein [Vibrio cholerae]CSC90012.1 Uncharacterised protein [Vibrio cholerae]
MTQHLLGWPLLLNNTFAHHNDGSTELFGNFDIVSDG